MTRQRLELVAHAWLDNKQVLCMSTNTQPDAHGTVLRRKRDGTRVSVPCPDSIVQYNKYMGGVDRGDQLRGYYRCQIKTRKFYKYIFFFLVDVAITNSFVLYRMRTGDRSVKNIKDFRLNLASSLIGSYSNRKRRGRVSRSIQPLPMLHFPCRVPDEEKPISKRGRCTYCMKTKKKRTDTTWYCNECEVWLCHTGIADTDCFLSWHMTQQ